MVASGAMMNSVAGSKSNMIKRTATSSVSTFASDVEEFELVK